MLEHHFWENFRKWIPICDDTADRGLCKSLFFRIREIKYIYVHNGNSCTKIFREEI